MKGFDSWRQMMYRQHAATCTKSTAARHDSK
jgi:hypothetical protein